MRSAIARLFRLGMRDADARFAKALTPRPSTSVDRYLASSLAIRTIDRLLQRWSAVWPRSITYRRLIAPMGLARNGKWMERYEFLGWTLLIAAMTHVALTMAQGPRPGWYWVVIPSMAIGFGVLLLAAAHSASRK
jgi:hypothetical protein